MRKILVTGCSGFIGMHLCENLLKDDFLVCGIDNMNDYYDTALKEERLKKLFFYDNFSFEKIDISNSSKLNKIFKSFLPEKVINLAAQAGVRYSLENPQAYINANIKGFLNILEASRYNNVKGLIYASSSSVYGGNSKIPFSENDTVDHPISIYAATKKSNELMAYSYSHLYNLNTTGLRFFTVYGPWGRPDMAMYIFADKIQKGKPINVFNKGKMKRDFTFIEDIISGTRVAIEKNYSCEIFNLGNNKCEELMKMINLIEKGLGKKANLNLTGMQPGDVKETFACIKKSKSMLRYDPKITIAKGIPKFLDWFKSYKP